MSDKSAIEWTDATWNPVRGCVKVSAGCKHCYAETFAERWRGVPGHAYEQGFDLRLAPHKLTDPRRWKTPKRIFVNSMSDLFQDGVPDEYIDRVFAVMALSPHHTFQILTKRPERMRAYMTAASDPWGARRAGIESAMYDIGGDDDARTITNEDWPLPNVWLGVSVENQHFADERIPLLLQTPAAMRFISAEPLLGPVNLSGFLRHFGRPGVCFSIAGEWWHDPGVPCGHCQPSLDWVIVGGESGVGARMFEVAWARSILRQCRADGVAVFVKQLGATPRDRNDAGFEGDTPTSWPMDSDVRDLDGGNYQGAPVFIQLSKKGGLPDEWPEDLRVRELPAPRTAV